MRVGAVQDILRSKQSSSSLARSARVGVAYHGVASRQPPWNDGSHINRLCGNLVLFYFSLNCPCGDLAGIYWP